MDLCCEVSPGLELLREQAEPLTRFAVAERYLMGGPTTSPVEAADAVETARKVRDAIIRALPNGLTDR